jgi:aminoglycoside phosphotransferase (APT) family kinase protein
MTESTLDQAAALQGPADQFRKLLPYLQEQLGLAGTALEIRQFPSGFSNLTYLIKSGDREWVLRRPPHGANIRSAHDMHREFTVLSLLKPIYPYVPTPLLYCEDEAVLGAPFYIMERVKGVILRNSPPPGLSLSPELMRRLSEKTVDHLLELHQLPLEGGLAELGKPEGYLQRQVEGWIQRYYKAETDTVPAMNATADWLRQNMPAYDRPAFIHNDFKYDNLVLDPGDLSRILAVLDWEMATVGDPLMDLGTSLGYWTEPNDPAVLKYNLTWLPGNLSREEVARRYAEQSGRDLSHILFYYAFGLFKIGVIVQQIYARYKKGLATDKRFAGLGHVLQACADTAQKAIALNRISHLY